MTGLIQGPCRPEGGLAIAQLLTGGGGGGGGGGLQDSTLELDYAWTGIWTLIFKLLASQDFGYKQYWGW